MTPSRIIAAESLVEVRPFRLDAIEDAGNPRRDAALERAHRQGFEAGVLAGRQEGIAQARAAHEARERAAGVDLAHRVAGVYADFDAGLAHLETILADRILALARSLAEQVVRQHLALDRDAVLAPLREAIATLTDETRRLRVYVSEADSGVAQIALEALVDGGRCRIVVDPALGAGECRVETPDALVDATLDSRWCRVTEAIGFVRGDEAHARTGADHA